MVNLSKKLNDGVISAKKFAYTTLYYTTGYSTVVGIGNGVAALSGGGDFVNSFNEGFLNNIPVSLAVNSIYGLTFPLLELKENFRTYAHAINLSLNSGFLAWHYYLGTENPLSACLPPIAIGLVMTEALVRRVQATQMSRHVEGLEAKIS